MSSDKAMVKLVKPVRNLRQGFYVATKDKFFKRFLSCLHCEFDPDSTWKQKENTSRSTTRKKSIVESCFWKHNDNSTNQQFLLLGLISGKHTHLIIVDKNQNNKVQNKYIFRNFLTNNQKMQTMDFISREFHYRLIQLDFDASRGSFHLPKKNPAEKLLPAGLSLISVNLSWRRRNHLYTFNFRPFAIYDCDNK